MNRRAPLILCMLFLIGACTDESAPTEIEIARPETAVDYRVELLGVERESISDLMKQALEIYRQQDRGAQSVAFLRRRAEGDVETVKKIMRSDGYFEADARFEIIPPAGAPPEDGAVVNQAAKRAAADAEAAETEDVADDASLALVRMIVEPSRRYTLAAHRFLLIETGAGVAPAAPDPVFLGSPVGQAARADRILAAESRAVDNLRAAGRPYAKRIDRDAVADPAKAEIEVETTIAAGSSYVFGPVTYVGVETIDREYLDTYIPFKEGEPVSPDQLVEFQRELMKTELFDAGSASLPTMPPDGPAAPVTVTLEEAKPRTVSLGALYSTDAGPAVSAGYEHRNLFGANETVTVDGLVGLEEQSLGARYRVPQWGRAGQDLLFGFELRHIDDDAYEEYGGTVTAGIERELTPELTIGFGGLAEIARVTDDDGTKDSRLIGLPLYAAFDNTNEDLDPSKGVRARVSATPFAGVVGDTPAGFTILDGSASTYFDLTGERLYILAARGRLGSILAGDFDVVAANRRLYSGGGGSVRGYAERFIGPLDADDDPTGGLSVAELGLEMRARVSETFGVVGFVEAGTVSTELFPAFDEGVQVAVGGGVRYFSPIGPLRFDIGIPVNPRDVDDFFQFYISIGQAY
ncbi:MAG: BamA/TamA family outer membrane protein [Paracoccaceae bacterium]